MIPETEIEIKRQKFNLRVHERHMVERLEGLFANKTVLLRRDIACKYKETFTMRNYK